MKKTTIASMIFATVVSGAVFFAVNNKQADAPNTSQTNSSSDSKPAASKSDSGGGKYIKYSKESIADTAGQKVLFFHAPWCPQCRSIEKGISAESIPKDTTIIKVDFDSNQDLRKKYGVTLQTTFVKIDDRGNEISKYVAYDKPTFDAVKRNLLSQ